MSDKRVVVAVLHSIACVILLGCGASFDGMSSDGQHKTEQRRGAGEAGGGIKRLATVPLVVDIHAHVFNARDLPIAGFATKIAEGYGLPRSASKALRKGCWFACMRVVGEEEKWKGCYLKENCERKRRSNSSCECVNLDSIERYLYKATADCEGPTNKCIVSREQATTARSIGTSAIRNTVLGKTKWMQFVDFLGEPKPPLARFLEPLAKSAKALAKTIALIDVVVIATRSHREIAVDIASATPDVDLYVPSLIDFGYFTEIEIPLKEPFDDKLAKKLRATESDLMRTQSQQIDAHGKLSEQSLKGNLVVTDSEGRKRRPVILPFVAFNPLRQAIDRLKPQEGLESALDVVKKAVQEKGFVGVKIYPPNGFAPLGNAALPNRGRMGPALDAALHELYRWCELNDVPIMAHASNSNGFGKDFGWLASPLGWWQVLRKYPRLRVNFGHFGHLDGVLDVNNRIRCLSWPDRFAELLRKVEGAYADMSYSGAVTGDAVKIKNHEANCGSWRCNAGDCPKTRTLIASLLAGEQDRGAVARTVTAAKRQLAGGNPRPFMVKQKLMYGSDWWMTAQDKHWAHYLNRFVRFVSEVEEESNVKFLRGFFGGNALRFLGLSKSNLNRNGCRVALRIEKLQPKRAHPTGPQGSYRTALARYLGAGTGTWDRTVKDCKSLLGKTLAKTRQVDRPVAESGKRDTAPRVDVRSSRSNANRDNPEPTY